MERYAIIDLGSNSVRMNIVHVEEDGSYILLDQAKEMVRLSENMGDEKTLKPDPMKRTVDALKLFKKLAVAYKASHVYALATAAVRMAKNQSEFLEKVKTEVGFDFTVLTGKQEAYYDYVGVINTIDIDNCLIVDIGGGSTELIWVENREHRASVSLPIGSVVLTENYVRSDKDGTKRAIDAIKSHFKEIPWLKNLKGIPVVGLGGVIRSVAKVDRSRNNLQALNLHNYRIPRKFCDTLFKKVLTTEPSELSKLSGINKKRADIMAGGILPIKLIMEALESDELIISGNGLRDGWFYEKYNEIRNMPTQVSDVLDHSLENLSKRYQINTGHSEKVRQLSLKLFDSLKVIHGFTDEYRKLVYAASLLHDIGMYIEYYNHHSHGFYLAMNSRLNGLTNTQIISCAYLIGMHRNEKLKSDLSPFEIVVSKREFKRLSDLALLLGLSEKLDRSESGTIKDLEVEIDGINVTVMLYAETAPILEMAAADEYIDKFSANFGVNLKMQYAGLTK